MPPPYANRAGQPCRTQAVCDNQQMEFTSLMHGEKLSNEEMHKHMATIDAVEKDHMPNARHQLTMLDRKRRDCTR